MNFNGYEQVGEARERYSGTYDSAFSAARWLRGRYAEYQRGVASQAVPVVREWFAEQRLRGGEPVTWQCRTADGRSVVLSVVPDGMP
ncbi:hypothetical protein LP52_08285 [Streptomonospora alba]|uniref:Uncharacterized protein n=1 Tax=Streptomonospora alba TaxID=183763 RepID=A0A0C2JD63_9ACTN|nr:hypothetical protein [Streptomonospora alba]KIH99346.1 hypothetical protein LP52_08285 [Streptomonospora alba]